MKSFQDQVVFITGASSGIGEALAREFARQGAKLVLAARRTDRLERLSSELKSGGTESVALAIDVTRDGDLEKAAQAAVAKFGKIDVVIANAGFGVVGNYSTLSLDDFRRQFETNVFGVVRTVSATHAALKKSKGRLVLIGSVAAYIGLPENAAYSMSKFAVRALAGSLLYEFKADQISVTLINPGFVNSEIRRVDNQGHLSANQGDPIPAWLPMPSDKAARQIVRATRRRKAEVVITAHGKIAVFLERHFPGLVRSAILLAGLKGRKQP